MPVYATTNNPSAVYPGDSVSVINAEASTVYPSGTASQQVAVGNVWNGNAINVSMEVQFSGNPGAFEIDLQDADTDSTNAYQNVPGCALTTATQASGSGAFFARCEAPVKAKFMRANV